MKTGALPLALAGSGIAVVTGAVSVAPQKPKPPTAVAAAPATSSGVLVYSFHATSRCGTCRPIEACTHETVTSRFGPDLQARRLESRAVTIEEAAYRHFIRDFRLHTRSVAVVDAKGSHQKTSLPSHRKIVSAPVRNVPTSTRITAPFAICDRAPGGSL